MITYTKRKRQRHTPEHTAFGTSNKFKVTEYQVQQAETLDECLQLAGSEADVIRLFNRAWADELRKAATPKVLSQSAVERLLKKVSPEVREQLRKLPHNEMIEVIRRVQKQTAASEKALF